MPNIVLLAVRVSERAVPSVIARFFVITSRVSLNPCVPSVFSASLGCDQWLMPQLIVIVYRLFVVSPVVVV